ncbi:hypothetical protein [Marisediminicola sp. LYQ85]|uniref:hypothetical protein n=1 Tax=Marisediminicola sp. LYQ85 TaxID=3391062 RepID=UPI003982E5DB
MTDTTGPTGHDPQNPDGTTPPPAPEPAPATPPVPAPDAAPAPGAAGGLPTGNPPQQPSPSGDQAPKKLGTGAIIGIVAGGVVLLLVLAVVVVTFAVRSANSSASGDGDGAPAAATSTPDGAVRGYLEALAASDAETALSFVGDAPAASGFLSDEALEASNAIAPITAIEVTEPAEADFSTTVTATYSLGDVPVSAEFSVNEYDTEGSWQMSAATAELDFGSRFEGLDLTLNGAPLESTTVEVFPGSYELATTTPNFTIEGETVLTVREPFDYPSQSDINAALTDEGLAVFRAAVRDEVEECLASKNFEAGCGLDLPEVLDDGSRLVEGSLTRTLLAETQATLDNLQPQELVTDPLVVSSEFIGGVNVEADVAQNGSTGRGDVLFAPSLAAPVVDFTSGTPVVRWD